MKTTLLASFVVSLFSTAAFAQQYRPAPPSGTAYGVTYGNSYPSDHDRDCDHDDDDDDDDHDHDYGRGRGRDRDGDGDVDRRDRKGHYEIVSTQQWVPGATTQVWVAGFCHRPPFSPIQVCTAGRYETRQGPGYYQTVQQRVWVAHRGRGNGNHWGRHGRR